jgi:undecaprenyl-diphosphatase
MSDICTHGLDTGFVALGYTKVAALGVLQGLTELMPISSTAHMRLVPAFLGWPDPGSAFSAAMQLAALAAVVTYFWRDVSGLFVNSLSAVAHRRFSDHSVRFVIWVFIATIPIGIAGLALAPILNACNSPLRRIEVIGWACVGLAALLGLTEILARHRRTMERATFWDLLLVGIAQVGALIPGVSRSGSTLTGALALGFRREEAARLSFLLGLPAITLAGLKELYELHKIHLSNHGWALLTVGLVVASTSAFFAIWALMRVLERYSSWPFVIYRFVLGVVILGGTTLALL